jgi:Family of unknown function (DUF6516)
MRNVSQYFEIIEKAIEYSPAEAAEIEIERRDATRGTIEGVVYFADGSRLEFTERVVIENRRPVKKEYRYQFVSRGVAVFRYDNAPHHRNIMTFPHHKHAGAKILPANEPDFNLVLDEAVALSNKETNQSEPIKDAGGITGRKRRRTPGKG